MFQEIRVNSSGIPYATEFRDSSFFRSSSTLESTHHEYPSPSLSSLADLTLTRLESYSPSSSTSSLSRVLLSASSPSLPLQKATDKQTPRRLFSRSFTLRSASSLLRRKPRRAVSQDPLSFSSSLSQNGAGASNIRSSWIVVPPKPLPALPQMRSPSESDLRVAGLHICFRAHMVGPQMHPRKRLVHLQKTLASAVLAVGMETPSTGTGFCTANMPGNKSQINKDNNSGGLFRGTYGQVTAALENAGLIATRCDSDGIAGATRLGALFVARPDGRTMQLTKLTLWG
ncbi:hypothetical protein EDD16DRAFT_828126 [Pisolithus croceorrhizus]|nr:hypothetical protein EDD16DRAFT_828126 [Pisolithus croceorrhizus]